MHIWDVRHCLSTEVLFAFSSIIATALLSGQIAVRHPQFWNAVCDEVLV
jgi:hypothetical protein